MWNWLINFMLLVAGNACLASQFDLGWDLVSKPMIFGALMLGSFVLFVLLNLSPVLQVNWALFSLVIFSVGVSLVLPLPSIGVTMLVAGLTVASGDVLYRYFSIQTDPEDERDDWFGSGAHLELAMIPIAGFVIGGAASIAGFLLR